MQSFERASRTYTRDSFRLLRRHFTAVDLAPPQLLLVYHSRTGLARQMADGLEAGARDAANMMGMDLEVVRKRAKDATAADVQSSSGYLFCAPENLASVSGEMKEFFDRTYYDMFDAVGVVGTNAYTEVPLLLGRPYGLAISAGTDGSAAAKQVERILLGWRLDKTCETLVVRNGLLQTQHNILAEKPKCSEETLERCKEIGGTVAATILL